MTEIDTEYWSEVMKKAQSILEDKTNSLGVRVAFSDVRKGLRKLQLMQLEDLNTALEGIVKKQKQKRPWYHIISKSC